MIVITIVYQNEPMLLEVDPNKRVGDLQRELSNMFTSKKWYLKKGALEIRDENKTLADYGINHNDVLHINECSDTAPTAPVASAPVASAPVASAPPQPPNMDRYIALANKIRAQLPPPRPRIDPDSADGQRLILEAINRERLNRNLEEAMNTMPESFVQVTMLYIDIKLNGVPVQSFVDCGAQTSIISRDLAQKCNLAHLIDERYRGVAKGVGEAKIVGRIHKTVMEAGGAEFDVSITVLEDSGHPLLFGLDLLYRHQCIIDLKQRQLVIGGLVKLPFLDASQIRGG